MIEQNGADRSAEGKPFDNATTDDENASCAGICRHPCCKSACYQGCACYDIHDHLRLHGGYLSIYDATERVKLTNVLSERYHWGDYVEMQDDGGYNQKAELFAGRLCWHLE
jgi:hypothetical protein